MTPGIDEKFIPERDQSLFSCLQLVQFTSKPIPPETETSRNQRLQQDKPI